jgi:integrase
VAKIIACQWTKQGLNGRKVKVRAFGYTLMVNGKRERKFSAEWVSKDEALTALEARKAEIKAGRIEPAPDRTLGQLADEYLTYKKGKKESLWLDTYMLRDRLVPAFGTDLLVRKLTAEMIARYEATRSAEVSAYTVSNELGCLRHMLRLGKRWGYLAEVPEITPPKKPKGRERFLSEPELGRLLEACDQSDHPFLGAMVRLAINTGMRRAELMTLRWEQVSLPTATITLYKTKNGEPRAVPINRATYDLLIGLQAAEESRQGPVFPRGDGGTWRDVRRWFLDACRASGIEGFRWHDLRHTCASYLVMRGRSLREVQEVLGHKDMRMTLRYSHLSASHKRATVDALDGLTSPLPMASKLANKTDDASVLVSN